MVWPERPSRIPRSMACWAWRRACGAISGTGYDPERLRISEAEDASLAASVLAVQEMHAHQGVHDRVLIARAEFQAPKLRV